MIRLVLVLFSFTVLLTQSGCTVALGGAKETNNTVFVEPGGVVRVATDEKIKVAAVDSEGKQIVTEKNIAGMYVLPESVYLKLTQEWEKNHPSAPKASPAKPVSVSLKKLTGLDTMAEEVPTDPPLVSENADHEAWMAEKSGGNP